MPLIVCVNKERLLTGSDLIQWNKLWFKMPTDMVDPRIQYTHVDTDEMGDYCIPMDDLDLDDVMVDKTDVDHAAAFVNLETCKNAVWRHMQQVLFLKHAIHIYKL
jgi:hypothetical protein